MNEEGAQVHDRLSAWFGERLDTGVVEICDLVHHADGFSWQTYTLTAHWRDLSGRQVAKGYAVRRQPEDGVLAPYDISAQYSLHRRLVGRAGIPVPDLYWLELDPTVIGMPFYVMERIEGAVPSPMARKPFAGDDAAAVGAQFVAILAAVHAVDWRELDLVDTHTSTADDAVVAAMAEVERWERFYESSMIREVPAIRAAFAWARDNLASSGSLVLCHGDYRTGNFVLRNGSIVGVLDWELAHVGDPVEDLAWAALPAFRGRSGMVGHMLSKREFIERYERHTGLHIHPDAFRFWSVINHVKAAAIFLRGARSFEDGRSNDLRLAMLAHRSTQLLADLLAELPRR
ncbi:MAG TPA: phosphotransferase family protein [Acidimicrobiales bacterium]|nr:phosphotransferase family protein [Acidimicrobiales bacterium]